MKGESEELSDQELGGYLGVTEVVQVRDGGGMDVRGGWRGRDEGEE